jgi:hypothetical protein
MHVGRLLGSHYSKRVAQGTALAVLALGAGALSRHAAKPTYVDITWMSVTNMYYEVGDQRILTDGYITRLPKDAFFGGGSGAAQTNRRFTPDTASVKRLLAALGGPSSVNLLLTGHSHFDHSFDTGLWSALTGAKVIGSRTTCFQVEAQRIPANRCTAVNGGERIVLGDGVSMYVVRFNHSGDPAKNPDQHNAVELDAPPRPDANGGLRAGLAEDFPNGGGNRAYLFVVDGGGGGGGGRFSWFFNNSASPVDLDVPIVVDGHDYGAPIENLKAALDAAKVQSVDLWIGAGGAPIVERLVPILHPRAYMPVHWDDHWAPFTAGVTRPYADSATERILAASNVRLIKPLQYMDKWRLDRTGVRTLDNARVKRALGF